MSRYVLLTLIVAANVGSESSRAHGFDAVNEDIALHRPYTYSRAPNYGLCSHDEERHVLTDGIVTEGRFWTESTTVGWGGLTQPVWITIDLGTAQTIGGASWRTAAGAAEVNWPDRVDVFASDDARTWNWLGDLVGADGWKPKTGYSVHTYSSHEFVGRGRFVRFVAAARPYLFVDEVQVFKGTRAPEPSHQHLSRDPADYSARTLEVDRRLQALGARLDDLRDRAAASRLGGLIASLRNRLPSNEIALASESTSALPRDSSESEFFSIRGALLHAEGYPSLSVWHRHRYDPLGPDDDPPRNPASVSLEVTVLDGERRADALNLTNATERDKWLHARFVGLPTAVADSLSLAPIDFVEAAPSGETTGPMIPLRRAGPDFDFWVAAGMNRQLWLEAHPQTCEPGTYEGVLEIRETAGPPVTRISVRIHIPRSRFPSRPRLHLGGWDYTDSVGAYGVTKGNRDLLISFLRSRFVDSPWATAHVLPAAESKDFDPDGKLIRELDYTALDDWMRRWSDAREYLIFANLGQSIAGFPMGAPQFDIRAGSYWSAVAAHLRTKGIQPSSLGVLVVDEPSSAAHAALVAAWAAAIRRAGEGIRVWEDPVYQDLTGSPGREVLQSSDDVALPTLSLTKYPSPRRLVPGSSALWLYTAAGPAHMRDPSQVERALAWKCFAVGATGEALWSFSDTGGASGWTERAATGTPYAPEYLGADRVSDSKHMFALVEGVEDYEELSMLGDVVVTARRHGEDSTGVRRAESLLEAVSTIVAEKPSQGWAFDASRDALDMMRVEALSLLEQIKARDEIDGAR